MSESFSTWRPLAHAEIDRLPECSGVYELATLVRTVLFIGAATENLRDDLMQHLGGGSLPLLRGSNLYFRHRATDDPAQLQSELLDDYRARHGGALPPAQSEPPSPPRPRRHLKAV